MSQNVQDVARRAIVTEAEGLTRLAEALPPDFAPFIDAVLKCTGRVILSGVGKSAHIGHKISATLASTGTPSLFVHATEASHGDLGMIVPGDICIIISRSGETRELQDVIAYCTRFDIPIAAITAQAGSTLGRASRYLLLIPDAPEACSIGMAPTTSSTLTLVLGDAIAVTLMEQRGFTAERFKAFHPGGKLGVQLATVGQLMHQGDLPIVTENTAMSDVLLTMTAHGLGAALVVQDGVLAGFITDGDLRRHMDGLLGLTARDIATKDPTTMHPDDFAAEALAVLNRLKVNVLPILDEARRPVGLLHMHDLVRAGVV